MLFTKAYNPNMTKLILSLIIVNILIFPALSHAEDSFWRAYGDFLNSYSMPSAPFTPPIFISPSSVSRPHSPVIIIPSTPGVQMHYSNNQYQGMSVTYEGGISTFYPSYNAKATGSKIVTCVNAGSVSYCY